MDIPGLSIFQGGESIQINNSINHIEEQEAIEDQKRRNEELGNVLQNAFDDLIDDEDITIDTSSNIKSECNQEQNYATNKNMCVKSDIDKTINIYNEENNHLKKVIASKANELENLSKILLEERKKFEELNKRFAITEAEKCRAQMARQQTHELLVESKAKFSELEDSVSKLKTKLKSSEETNNKLQEDLERTRLMLSDVQQKYHMVEKNAGFNADRRVDILIKQTNDRHNAQVEVLQQQLEILRNKLDEKDKEINSWDTRYKELQRNREALLVDKSETINQLAKSLEESQQQCQKLITKKDFAQENASLKRIIDNLEQQCKHQQKTINDLRYRLDSTTAELALMDSVLHENMDTEINSPKHINFTKQNFVESTPLTTNDRLERLKSELYRSIANQKSKREDIRKYQAEVENKNIELKQLSSKFEEKCDEIKTLQREINSKDSEIKCLKDEENKCLIIIDTQKEEKIRLENRIKVLENELNEINKKILDFNKITSLENENEELKSNQKILEEKIEKYMNTELFSKSISKPEEKKFNELDSQLKNLNIDLEELKQEHESLKNNYEIILKENVDLKERKLDPLRFEYERQKFLLKDAQNECDRIKNLYVEISNSKEQLAIELETLKAKDVLKELQEENGKCIKLERALQLEEMKCSEVKNMLEIEKSNHESEIKKLKDSITKEKCESSKIHKSPLNCSKCLQHTAEISQLEISKFKLENQCAIYRRQVNDLREQILKCKEIISELNEKLGLKEDQDKVIAELKEKAQHFEEYIESYRTTNTNNSSPRGGSSTTSGICSPKTLTARTDYTEKCSELNENKRREFESSMRDEMAKVFAKELKAMEECFRIRLKEFEDENNLLKTEMKKFNSDLSLRQNEIQILKYTIMSEREKFDDILNKKDLQFEKVTQKYTNILHKCREELKLKQDRVKELIKELDDRNIQIENERHSMKAVMQQWEESRTLSDNKEKEMLKCINEMKNENAKIIASWKAKYESAKKTANNYKLYAEEKEQHIMKEFERMKTEFEIAKTKLKNKYHDLVLNEIKN